MKVKLITRMGHAELVEWVDDGELKRGLLPAGTVDRAGNVALEELWRAAPYGLPWEELVELRATPEELARQLRMRGIWTKEDLRKNAEAALGAILQTYGVDYQQLLVIANRR